MLHDIIFLILGLVLIIAGGNFVTDGATTVARRMNVSGMVIGLTVVAFGSSAPDFVVCLTSTLAGKSQMALGDVVGSNIFDILLVVGVVAMVRPVAISSDMLRADLPMLVLSSLVIFFCGDDLLFDGSPNILSRTDGLMILCFFVIFMAYTFRSARNHTLVQEVEGKAPAAPEPRPVVTGRQMWIAAASIAGGLAALIAGGNWIVSGASGIALKAGLSEGLVGLTIVAFGSASPDLATSLIAAVKKQPGIALGNVVGSCIFNVFFILGFCATIRPLNAGTISVVDFGTLAGGSVLLWLTGRFYGQRIIRRSEGAILAVAYLAYMAYLIAQMR